MAIGFVNLRQEHYDVVMRVDINEHIGSGHAIRCGAIADAIKRRGGSVLFAVSDERSVNALRRPKNESVVVLADDCMSLDELSGDKLSLLCNKVQANAVLVDSYGITNPFFAALSEGTGSSCKTVWIDDWYTYESGRQCHPIMRRVDCVVNYSLGMCLDEYKVVYGDKKTDLFINPCYAPVRSQFVWYAGRSFGSVERILVTAGSTNEGYVLEQMVSACLKAVPNACVDVIVGSMADFVPLEDDRVVEHRGVTDLSPFMRASDVCVSAAGTTLYELSSVGVPTVTVAVVENQVPNAIGFERLGLGQVVNNDADMGDRLAKILRQLASAPAERRRFVGAMHKTIDGGGAERIASILNG